MDNLIKKLHLIKENPGYYSGLSPEEQAELFLFLLTPKRNYFKRLVANFYPIIMKNQSLLNFDYLSCYNISYICLILI